MLGSQPIGEGTDGKRQRNRRKQELTSVEAAAIKALLKPGLSFSDIQRRCACQDPQKSRSH
jgi:hypothetical protein